MSPATEPAVIAGTMKRQSPNVLPNCAAQLGFDVADQAQKQGHILTSEQFHDLFVDAYLDIVAPDA
jgi:hypothetical protein